MADLLLGQGFCAGRVGMFGGNWARIRGKSSGFWLAGLLILLRISTVQGQGLDTLKGAVTCRGMRVPYAVLSHPAAHAVADSTHDSVDAVPAGVPVILFLHGAGERGTDNQLQLLVGLPVLVKTLNDLGTGPYVIVAPQCPRGRWVETDWTLPSHRMVDTLTPMLLGALMVLDSVVRATPNADTNCVYVTGISMGGFGCWELAQRYPKRWAAVMPLCGGGDTTLAAGLRDLPIWAFHGQKDKLVKPSRTTDMVRAITRHGGKPQMTMYPDIGHLVWNTVYADKKVIQWLLNNRRS